MAAEQQPTSRYGTRQLISHNLLSQLGKAAISSTHPTLSLLTDPTSCPFIWCCVGVSVSRSVQVLRRMLLPKMTEGLVHGVTPLGMHSWPHTS
jgi:hypothetical protein